MAAGDDGEEKATVELEFFARADHLAEVRKLVERLAAKTSLNRGAIDDFLTAVDEAVANAIRHGSPRGEKNLVTVTCHAVSTALEVQVRDQGSGFSAPRSAAMPAPEAARGRGLPLMCALADSVEIASKPTGTTVTLKRCFQPTRAGMASDRRS